MKTAKWKLEEERPQARAAELTWKFHIDLADPLAGRWTIALDLRTGQFRINGNPVIDVSRGRSPLGMGGITRGLNDEMIVTFAVRQWALRRISRDGETFWDCRGRV